MFSKLLDRLFGRWRKKVESTVDRLAVKVTGQLPNGAVPVDKILCLFDRGRLVNSYRDEAVPKERREGEEWWLIPREDLPLKATVPLPDENGNVTVEATVRFDPDTELGTLLAGRDHLSREEVLSLVTSQLTGLLEMAGYANVETVESLDVVEMERMRARLSLLLQGRGLRCTDLSPFAAVSHASQADTITIPVFVEAEAKVSPLAAKDDSLPSKEELAEVVAEVKTSDDWDQLVTAMEQAGCQFDEKESQQLVDMGENVLARKVKSTDVATKLSQMTEQATRRAAIPKPDLRRWRGLDLRLQTLESDSDAPLASLSDEQKAERAGAPDIRRRRRPWTFWMFTRRSIDDRLVEFLTTTLGTLRSEFDSYRSRTKDIKELVKLRKIDERLGLGIDLLKTMPTLSPAQRNLRLNRGEVKQLVRRVEGAVTAIEMAQAEIKAMKKHAAGGEEWHGSAESICAALDRLNGEIKERRELRMV